MASLKGITHTARNLDKSAGIGWNLEGCGGEGETGRVRREVDPGLFISKIEC